MIDFYEQMFDPEIKGDITIDDIMTEEEQERASFYAKEYSRQKQLMKNRSDKWLEIEEAYSNERVSDPVFNNNDDKRINILQPQIEGQVTAMTNSNISGVYRGVGFSDQKFASTASKIGDFILNQNNIRSHVKKFGRRYVKFGTSVLHVEWDNEALNDTGLPIFTTPKLSTVFVDDKIDDLVMELDKADYIIQEIGKNSLEYLAREFSEDYLPIIQASKMQDDFEQEDTTENTFMYLKVWTKNNEKRELELIEMTEDGIILKRDGKDNPKPYYKHTFNRYPFFFATLYDNEQDIYGYGDGDFLLPYQKYIDKLMDIILRATSASSLGRTYFDPQSHLDIYTFTEGDPLKPIPCKNPNSTIRTERGQGVSDIVFRVLEIILQQVYNTTRFSPLMTGNNTGENMTATQAGIQLQQGQTGIDDKKKDISYSFGKCLGYAIGLCMEKWDSAIALRIADNEEKFEWIDARQLAEIPVMIPSSNEYTNAFKNKNPDAEVPEYMQLSKEEEFEVETDNPLLDEETGNPIIDEETSEPLKETVTKKETKYVTKELELDIDVTIGEGIPNNKVALYNIMLQLSQIQLLDEKTGALRPIVTYNIFKDIVEETLGIVIKDEEMEQFLQQQQMEQQQMAEQQMAQSGMPGSSLTDNKGYNTTNPSGLNVPQMEGMI